MNSNLFKFSQIRIPKRSGFDKSFKNLLTIPVGTLVPLLCDEVVPNTRIKLKALLSASLPPLATDAHMNVKLKAEAFFVPMRQLYGGFEKWLTRDKVYDSNGNAQVVQLPRIEITGSVLKSAATPAKATTTSNIGLCDYLGIKFTSTELANIPDANEYHFNIFPFMAYHWIWSHWYRNSQIQKDPFQRPDASVNSISVANLPFMCKGASTDGCFKPTLFFADGNYNLFWLRQRNFGADYFTTAFTQPQQGDAQGVTIDTSGSSTSLTISALRQANSMQQFLERNQIAGFRLVDYVADHYGAHLSDGNANRPLFLGASSIDVYTKGVDVTTNLNISGNINNNNNPFGKLVGARYGQCSAGGELNLIDDFVAEEPGYIMVLISLVPKVVYSSGVLRQLMHYNRAGAQVDMANPLLQNVGNQPIYQSELYSTASVNDGNASVFGYTQRYADFMARDDELHGILRDGESLASFALQRYVVGPNAVQGNTFLQIPRDYLDQVCAASSNVSNYGAWIDSFLDYKVSMPLAQFSIPSLQDPAYEHGDSKVVRSGGSRLD